MTPHTVFANDLNCFTGLSIHATPPLHHPPRLTRDQAIAIRAGHAAGLAYRALAVQHGTSRDTIFKVVRYRGAYASLL